MQMDLVGSVWLLHASHTKVCLFVVLEDFGPCNYYNQYKFCTSTVKWFQGKINSMRP